MRFKTLRKPKLAGVTPACVYVDKWELIGAAWYGLFNDGHEQHTKRLDVPQGLYRRVTGVTDDVSAG